MTVASEVHLTLQSMGFVQLLLALAFLTSYAVACSAMFESRGRWRGALAALAAGAGFVAATDPWVHGAMLMAGAIAGMGLFSATAWLLGRTLRVPDAPPAPAVEAMPAVEAAAVPTTAHALPRDSVHAT
jgi:hypothetical protein